MILERAEIPVEAGKEEAFVQMMKSEGLSLLRTAEGCASARLGRGVENPTTFLLLIEWGSVDQHLTFTRSPTFDQFKALAGSFFAGASRMEHFQLI